MSVVEIGGTEDSEGRGQLCCDVPSCQRRYTPRSGVTDHETLSKDANKRGWDCDGFERYDGCDRCPEHARRCVAMVGRSRRHADAGLKDLPCGQVGRHRTALGQMCGTHHASWVRALKGKTPLMLSSIKSSAGSAKATGTGIYAKVTR